MQGVTFRRIPPRSHPLRQAAGSMSHVSTAARQLPADLRMSGTADIARAECPWMRRECAGTAPFSPYRFKANTTLSRFTAPSLLYPELCMPLAASLYPHTTSLAHCPLAHRHRSAVTRSSENITFFYNGVAIGSFANREQITWGKPLPLSGTASEPSPDLLLTARLHVWASSTTATSQPRFSIGNCNLARGNSPAACCRNRAFYYRDGCPGHERVLLGQDGPSHILRFDTFR